MKDEVMYFVWFCTPDDKISNTKPFKTVDEAEAWGIEQVRGMDNVTGIDIEEFSEWSYEMGYCKIVSHTEV